jgi:hypothetical protein
MLFLSRYSDSSSLPSVTDSMVPLMSEPSDSSLLSQSKALSSERSTYSIITCSWGLFSMASRIRSSRCFLGELKAVSTLGWDPFRSLMP